MSTEHRQKIAALCEAMGATHRIVTAKGWSRLYVREAEAESERQIGRAWQREGEDWELSGAVRTLREIARRKVARVTNAVDIVSRARASKTSAQTEVTNLESRLVTARAKLTNASTDLARALVSLDAIEATMTDRDRAVLAALEAVK